MGGPRYEAALLAGLLGPFFCTFAALRSCGAALTAQRSVSGESLLKQALADSFAHVAVLFGVATIWGAATGYCEPLLGYGLLALGPSMGMILAGLWGAVTALGTSWVVRPALRKGWGIALAASAPLSAILWGLYRFYDSPSVYAYSPFVGYFAGPLYDNVEYDLERLSGYRMGTLMTCLAVGGFMACFRSEPGPVGATRLVFQDRSRERIVLLVTAAIAALGSLVHSSMAEEMGYGSSTSSIVTQLGRSLEKGPCRVIFSRHVDELEANQIADECVGHIGQLAKYFELEDVADVDVYLFGSQSEKKHLMGAGSTYIAKPWRREIYIQPAGFPHPVLGHELAHVVTERFGQGPFRIAGALGGWLPDPGRIEGFAEAASPKEHSEGTLHEWTAAMKELNLLPPLSSLFQLSFLGSSPARAYSASGSFVDFIRDRHGADALKRWYGGAELSSLTGATWGELERDFHRFLDGVDVPERVLEIARPRFSRPGVFERSCPHAVDRLIGEAVALCPYQEEKAQRLAREAIRLDGTKKDLDLSMARCAFYQGDPERSLRQLRAGAESATLYDPEARRAAWEFAGNISWAMGRLDEARKELEAARELTFHIDAARNLEVKLWALGQEAAVQRPLRYLLAPRPRERQIPQVYLSEWLSTGPHQELARYLLARTLFMTHAEQADAIVEKLVIERLPLESLELEAARMQLLSSCRSALRGEKRHGLEKALTFLLSQKPHEARAIEATRIVERCRIALGPEAPK